MSDSLLGRLRQSTLWSFGKEPFAFGLLAAIVGAGISLLLPPLFLVRAQMVLSSPAQGPISGSLLNLAQQFGIGQNLGQNTPDLLQAFFASEDVLEEVVQTRFQRSTYVAFEDRTACDTRWADCDLVRIWRARGKSPRDTLERTALALANAVSTDIDARSGIVNLGVKARTPELALAIAKRLIQVVDSASVAMQRKQAENQLRFMEGQVESARLTLRAAEDTLAAFDLANRLVQSSPSLVRFRTRLQRAVTLDEGFYIQLKNSVEQLYLLAARNVSTISMVQSPQLPGRRYSPKRRIIVLLAFGLGILAWVARRYGRRLYDEFQSSVVGGSTHRAA